MNVYKKVFFVIVASFLMITSNTLTASANDDDWKRTVFGWSSSYTESLPIKNYQRQSSRKTPATRTEKTTSPITLNSILTGIASYYWQPQRVAAGGWFNPNAMTAAHKTLPFGTKVRVTHVGNGKSVDVVINDRGPYIAGRIIDLSKAAAAHINMLNQGIAQVRVEIIRA